MNYKLKRKKPKLFLIVEDVDLEILMLKIVVGWTTKKNSLKIPLLVGLQIIKLKDIILLLVEVMVIHMLPLMVLLLFGTPQKKLDNTDLFVIEFLIVLKLENMDIV